MRILSLFGGIETGLIALKELGIKIENYYSSEIDKYAIAVAKYNHPEIQHLGDINDYQKWQLPKIDLVIGGSPCQGFSFAGKQLNFNDPRSELFFKFVEILWMIRENNPDVKFLLENVKMKKEYQNAISELLEVDPILINSNLVSAQNRKRLYWCNWHTEQPKDKNVLLKDIIGPNSVGVIKNNGLLKIRNNKSYCIDANYYKGIDNHGQRTFIIDGEIKSCLNIVRQRKRGKNPGGFRFNKSPSMSTSSWTDNVHVFQFSHGCSVGGIRNLEKCPTLSSQFHNNYFPLNDESCLEWLSLLPYKILRGLKIIRKFHRHELESLQTLPHGYTKSVSYTQSAKSIGNGWTKDIIKHILSQIKS